MATAQAPNGSIPAGLLQTYCHPALPEITRRPLEYCHLAQAPDGSISGGVWLILAGLEECGENLLVSLTRREAGIEHSESLNIRNRKILGP